MLIRTSLRSWLRLPPTHKSVLHRQRWSRRKLSWHGEGFTVRRPTGSRLVPNGEKCWMGPNILEQCTRIQWMKEGAEEQKTPSPDKKADKKRRPIVYTYIYCTLVAETDSNSPLKERSAENKCKLSSVRSKSAVCSLLEWRNYSITSTSDLSFSPACIHSSFRVRKTRPKPRL